MTRFTPLLLLGSISLGLTGCASHKDRVLPDDGPTIASIYQQHLQTLGSDDPTLAQNPAISPRPIDDTPLPPGMLRDAQTELDTRFPRLPNPSLVLYVYPHLSGEGAPVPGYATTFPLYERVHYALPGEVSMPRQRPTGTQRATDGE